jgi:hypothetical protein
LNNFTTKQFIETHLQEYSNIIKNFSPESRFVLNPKLILERYDVFLWIMRMMQMGDLEKIYHSLGDKEFNKFYMILESNLLKG